MSTLQQRIQPALDARDASLEKSAFLAETSEELPLDTTLIPRQCGLLTEEELDLTENYDATDLLEMLASKKVSSATLLTAFRKRATIAQQCTNCLTELVPDALIDAKACDDYLAETGNTKGPLHGLPVSVKEIAAVGGRLTNIGFVAWVNGRSQDDANIVQCLKRLGAIVFARTNVPQSLMQLETSNNIYGDTVNPRMRKYTSGGSTGGEGALMGMKGTPLGIGGDIGGSIRVPAALNGLYGMLPTPGRICGAGVKLPSPGADSIAGTLGPFARSLRDIEMFCNAYSSAQAWLEDTSIMPCDILNPTLGRSLDPNVPLRVGIILDDGYVSPLPPVRRVLNKIKAKLENAPSIQVKDFQPMDHEKGWRIISALYFEDGGADVRRICEEGSEPLRPLTEWILNECQSNVPAIGSSLEERKDARDTFRAAYATHWNKAEVDVVIAPVTPSTAPALGTSKYWAYSAIWNLLSYPAIVLPGRELSGEENAASEVAQERYEPKNDIEAYLFKHYDVSLGAQLPVGIQVVAPRLHESLLMKAAYIIEAALKEQK